jgi:glycosyltransferase involved in cell wall biosynthesis
MLVSILIPCFNAERWIAQAIHSALAQSWPDTEVVVVDDGSTDGSVEAIKTFEGRIRWESGPNRGSNPARNRLLALAEGTWVQYLDADDYLLPGKIAAQMRCLDAGAGADVIYGPCLLEHAGAGGETRERLLIPEPRDPWVLLARWFLPQTGAALWKKAAIVDVGGWREDQPACQEHELYLRLLMAGKQFRYCDDAGAVYRQWSENTLWRADKGRTRRLRLEIVDRLETYLGEHHQLTAERHWAINQSRFETARTAWVVDRDEALNIVTAIRHSDRSFVPAGAAARRPYRLLYRWLGFAAVETLAAWRRHLFGASPR